MWREDKKHGQGMQSWANGDKYGGEFENGLKHGTGAIYYSDGTQYAGEWFEDVK
jgi:hypothetical protein